jgi:hypothetical protein
VSEKSIAERWRDAKAHFDRVRQLYQDLEGTPGVNTSIALRVVFDPMARRYNAGERTMELLEALEGVK